jgi:hypothetical protein
MISTFKSNDENVSDILAKIDSGEIQLPDFQRGWVWSDDRIRSLIASISNSYPVGALMFLEYGESSIRFKYRPFENSDNGEKPRILVLDGQQRLTSIYSAMYSKKPVSTKTEKNKEITVWYYLDINKCLSSNTDRIDAIISVPEDRIIKENFGRDIVLDLSTQEKEFENHMFPLNIAFVPYAQGEWRNKYQKFHNYNPSVMDHLIRFESEIIHPMGNYKVPVITLSNRVPKEAVCQVFENVNTGGVSLTVFELITATFAADNFELRKDWDKRFETMIDKSKDLLSEVSSTDFLTAVTLLSRYYVKLSGGEAVSCKKKDVLNLSLQEYTKYADELTSGFIEASKFLREERIFSPRDLPYSTQLIPLSVLFAILKNRSCDGIIRDKIAQWYWCGVFGEMYGGANESRYVTDVTGMMNWIHGNEEPDTIARAYFQPTRLLILQSRLSAAYKGIMALLLKNGALDFISGKAMDFTNFLEESVDIHHIFPKHYCESESIQRKKWNSIINKTPLSSRTNRVIGGKAPSKYCSQIERSDYVDHEKLNQNIRTHLIDVEYLRSDDFEHYFIERAKALLNLISTAMNKPISNLDGEDVIKEFGQALQ